MSLHFHSHDSSGHPASSHQHGGDGSFASAPRPFSGLRYLVAVVIVAGLVMSACLVLIGPGNALVITRFGNPIAVVTQPGLAWRLPAPIENTTSVDLRLRTTSSGLQDVGTRDGLRVLMQAYVAWQYHAIRPVCGSSCARCRTNRTTPRSSCGASWPQHWR